MVVITYQFDFSLSCSYLTVFKPVDTNGDKFPCKMEKSTENFVQEIKI